MISQVIADKLNIAIGEDVVVHFFQNPPRSRKLFVSGIYETNLSEYYDDKIILGDINLIRRLNNWPDSLAGGMEVFLSKPSEIAMVEELINDIIPMDQYAERVSDKYIQVFEWLNLIRRQVNIFLVIILLVVCVNMISIILILIMERTQMIGTLKALGSDNKLIRRIFSFSGMQLLVRGLIIGNVVGLGVCFLQDYFEIITLNPKDYYMSVVPIGWNWLTVLLLNVLTFITVFFILTLPAALIARVQPIKAIKFN
ncbi:MAG: FtsX-like permease family protein, partial [Cyclobacteriaceae bacterium]|nr:FtsX-like permease family protein [Cyclobacteriaceae bacterium]